MRKLTKQRLKDGLNELAARDRDVARALAEVGFPALRRRPAGFATLMRAIVAQQVSVAAAAAIWQRLVDTIGEMTPEALQRQDDAALRAAGLSRQKLSYARDLSEACLNGALRLDALGRRDDEEAIAELIRVRGIGRWSAEVYLLFALGRPDIWPVDDIGLMAGMERLKRLAGRPKRKEMLALGEAWRPWRGAAAHMLWHYYAETNRRAAAENRMPV